ncbi:MAG: hypothetical protein K2P17_05845 [Helicobacteraceae bacterium]|nr:hypothetical protein [Helicobacteraceae bacterium]
MKVAQFAIAICIIFSACATPKVENLEETDKGELKLILIKSQNIKFYDFGILRTTPNISLEVFKLGKSIGRFTIEEKQICFNDDCAPKWPASRSFFGNVSYDTLLEEILLKKDIFEGRGKELGEDETIIQKFSYGNENIYYERGTKRIYFKNLTNGVTISIENYEQ